jgi:hypothetical protein
MSRPRLAPTFRLVRNVDIGLLQDTFLVSAAGTVIVIRLQLWLTNYPQLGGGRLHIAHLLWGGLFMVMAIGLLLSFLGRRRRLPAAVLGGVGFGFFIDELGKFVTDDNDYFFKPTATIIYIVFILLYLITRRMQTYRGFSERENLVNAVDLLAEAARAGLDDRDRSRALTLLDEAGPSPLADPLRDLVRATAAIPRRPPGPVARAAGWLRSAAERLADQPRFRLALTWAFAIWTVGTFLTVLELVAALGLKLGGAQPGFASDALGSLQLPNIASLVSSLVAAVLVTAGILRLRRGELAAGYRLFARAMLVEIFITQVFVFVESSFSAISGLLVSIALLITVSHLERRALDGDAAPAGLEPPPAPGPAVAHSGTRRVAG